MKKHGKKKWLQKADEKMEKKGTKGSFGHHSMDVIDKDIKKGGKLAKKAQFAKNMKKLAAKRHHKKSAGKRARKA